MKILNVQQGTEEWKSLRNNYFTASEASIMMGVSPNCSRNDLLYMKYTGENQNFSEWLENVLFAKGHEIEKLARPMAEEIIGQSLFPSVGISDDNHYLASFDGMTMDQEIIWECKQWNEKKAKEVWNKKIPDEDLWQVVHQLVVSESEKCLYMVTDGTPDKTVYCWHTLDRSERIKLMLGWDQFAKDLDEYKIKDYTQATGEAPNTLPLLHIEVTGMVKSSNLDEFKDKALTTLEQINTDLQTDSDFATAEKTIKWCKDIEERLDFAKEQAISQTATIDELFKTIDSIKELTRNKRLQLDRTVTQRKKSIRVEIAENAENTIYQYIESKNKQLRRVYLPFNVPDFSVVMKGKKNIKSLHDAVDDLIAKTKIEINAIADVIASNVFTYETMGINHDFLFHDLQQIITKPNEDFTALVRMRIMEYKNNGQAHVEQLRKTLSTKQAEAILNTNRPSDEQIINVLSDFFNVTNNIVLQWLSDMFTEGNVTNVKR